MARPLGIDQIGPDTPARDAARAILAAKVQPLFDLEEAAASGTDADAVHDMRVASRRVREALRVFTPVYRKDAVREMDALARAVTRALGTVRDADVLIGALERFASKAEDESERAVLAYLIGYRRGVREAELARMRRRLERLDLRDQRRRFERALRDSRHSPQAGQPLARMAREVTKQRLDEFFDFLPAALVPENIEAQHHMRIAGKHLRYAVETLSPCVVTDRYAELHSTLVRYQDLLGEMHDCDVWTAYVMDVGLTPEAARAGLGRAGVGALLEDISARRRRYFDGFREHLASFGEEALRNSVVEALLDETPEPAVVTTLVQPAEPGPLAMTADISLIPLPGPSAPRGRSMVAESVAPREPVEPVGPAKQTPAQALGGTAGSGDAG